MHMESNLTNLTRINFTLKSFPKKCCHWVDLIIFKMNLVHSRVAVGNLVKFP